MVALTVLVLGTALLSAVILWLFSGRRTKQLMDRLPGPPAWPLVGNALEFSGKTGTPEFLRQVMKYVGEYRDKKLCKLWLGNLPAVLLFKAETAEVVLRSNRLMTKGQLYDFLHPWLGTGLLTSTGDKWRSRRKLLTPTFHFSILQDFVQVFNEQAEVMVAKLDKLAQGQQFDIFQTITLCALDIICETAMGRTVGAQQNSESDYVKKVYKISELLLNRMFSPWLYTDIVYSMSKPGKEFADCLRVLHGFTEKVIKERQEELEERLAGHTGDYDLNKLEESREALVGRKKRLAFLDMLLYAAKGDPSLDFLAIREEVDTFMFEGHDTTAAGINWAVYLIGSHPQVQQELHEEVDHVFGNDKRGATMEDLSNLKLLERVIKESLRIFPSVPLIGRTITEECEAAGYTLPVGATAVIIPYALHMDPDHFPEPHKFDPDRWLPDNAAKRHPYCYVPFSAGLRNCIGQKFALLEEKVLLSSMLRNFHIESTQKREELNPMGELIMRPEHGIRVKLTRRQP